MSYARQTRLSPYANEDEVTEGRKARAQLHRRRLRRRRQLRRLYRRYRQRQRALAQAVEEQRRSEQEVLGKEPISNLVSAFLPYLPPGSIETPTWIGISSSTSTFSPTTTYTSPLSLVTETRSKFTYSTGKKTSRKKRRNLVGGPNDPEDTSESTTRPITTIPTTSWSSSTTTSSSISSNTSTTSTSATTTSTSSGAHTTTSAGGVSPGQGSNSDIDGGSQGSGGKPSPGLIVGSVVGSVLGAAILVALLIWLCKTRTKKDKATKKRDSNSKPNEKDWRPQDSFAPSPQTSRVNLPNHSQTRNSRRWGYTPRPGVRGYTPRVDSRNSGANSLRPSFMEQIQNRGRSPLGYAPVIQPPEDAGSIHSSSDSGEVYHTTDWVMGAQKDRDSDADSNTLGLGLHRSSESTSSSVSSDSSIPVQGRSLTSTLKPLPPIPPPILPPIPIPPPIPTPIIPLKSPRRLGKMPAGVSSSSNPNRHGFLSPRTGPLRSEYQSDRYDLDAARWREERNQQYGGQDDVVSRISSEDSGHSIKSPMTVSSIGDWDLGTGPPAGMSYSYWGQQKTPRR
ncbi:unnamed protein product [Clonostachys rosea]|uniref:Mid2 domain-containing protein n=1 Tax=Bionectria ochroleuca TaxID=29856 RepID=A0ABY6TQ00_BIOOC|nr:unnamed protein product [Clonostachys rosea]